MLERLLVALLAGGHVLLEGVPGLAKTLTVKTLAQVLGGIVPRASSSRPTSCPPTSSARASTGRTPARFDIELGPVFAQLPARRRDQPRAGEGAVARCWRSCRSSQVTIGGTTYPVPQPFLVLATQNPIESEGTYPLPEAQIDRFLMKLVVDYPDTGEEAAIVGRSLGRLRRAARAPVAAPTSRAHRERRRGGVRRPRGHRLRGRAGRRDAQPREHGLERDRAVHRVRRQPARADRPGDGGAGAGAAARARPRGRRRRPRRWRPTSCATASCCPTTR